MARNDEEDTRLEDIAGTMLGKSDSRKPASWQGRRPAHSWTTTTQISARGALESHRQHAQQACLVTEDRGRLRQWPGAGGQARADVKSRVT